MKKQTATVPRKQNNTTPHIEKIIEPVWGSLSLSINNTKTTPVTFNPRNKTPIAVASGTWNRQLITDKNPRKINKPGYIVSIVASNIAGAPAAPNPTNAMITLNKVKFFVVVCNTIVNTAVPIVLNVNVHIVNVLYALVLSIIGPPNIPPNIEKLIHIDPNVEASAYSILFQYKFLIFLLIIFITVVYPSGATTWSKTTKYILDIP